MADNTILYGKWYFNETIDALSVPTTSLNFTFKSNEEFKNGIKIGIYSGTKLFTYYLTGESWIFPYSTEWASEEMRTIVITNGGDNIFLTWLQANATKVNDSLDIEDLKTNKMIYEEQMHELVDTINEKAGSSGSKNISGLIETAKNIVKPSGTIIITEKGNYNVEQYKNANVDIETGIVPSGTLSITKNGNYDVTEYASVSVATPSSDGEIRSLKKYWDFKKSASYGMQNATYEYLDDFFVFDDTSNITDARNFFYNCANLKALPNLDWSSNIRFDYFCNGCSSLEGEIVLRCPNSSNQLNYTFNGCKKITKISILELSFSANTFDLKMQMEYLARNCINLTEVYFDTTVKALYLDYAFDGCTNLLKVSPMDLSEILSYKKTNIFRGCTSLTEITFLNIKLSIVIASGDGTGDSDYGTKLTLESLLGLCQECINTGNALTLTVGSANITKLSEVYVKLTNEPEVDETLPKLPMVQCESTEEGAMLVSDYMALKQWSLA